MLTIYTKPGCVQCVATKRKATEKNIPHTMIDVTADDEALETVKTLGYLQVPVVVAPDGAHWSGFRPDLIETYAA